MSWVAELDRALAARGVPAAQRRRIVLEYEDHVGCEPASAARLGDPAELARAFADQLGARAARASAGAAFGALAVAAVAFVVSLLTIPRAGGYPAFDGGHAPAVGVIAVIGLTVAPQVALVAGCLAALRAWRRREAAALPAAEVALVRRRTAVALSAGAVTLAALAAYAWNDSAVLAGWWVALTAGLAGAGAVALAAAASRLAGARGLRVSVSGAAGDVRDDLGLPGVGLGWLALLVIAAAAAAVAVATGVAERSVVEGLERGAFEALAAGAGFAALGRHVGARAPAGA